MTSQPPLLKPTPFQISISSNLLSFINQRVATARIPPGLDLPAGKEWSYGVPAATIEPLREYWEKKYDWRAVEASINAHLRMFTMWVPEGEELLEMHFV